MIPLCINHLINLVITNSNNKPSLIIKKQKMNLSDSLKTNSLRSLLNNSISQLFNLNLHKKQKMLKKSKKPEKKKPNKLQKNLLNKPKMPQLKMPRQTMSRLVPSFKVQLNLLASQCSHQVPSLFFLSSLPEIFGVNIKTKQTSKGSSLKKRSSQAARLLTRQLVFMQVHMIRTKRLKICLTMSFKNTTVIPKQTLTKMMIKIVRLMQTLQLRKLL